MYNSRVFENSDPEVCEMEEGKVKIAKESIVEIRAQRIKKAINMGVSFVKPPTDSNEITCLDSQAGYGESVHLTLDEYDVYTKVSMLTKEEQHKRLDEYIEKNRA